MLRWRFWAGRRDRLALALVGVFILATGLSVISMLSDSVRGTVAKEYEQTWRSPYDILVHVPLPDGQLLPDIQEPNALTTLPSGITLAQVEEIRQVEGVDVTAPLAVVGFLGAGPTYDVPSAAIPKPPDGLYQFRQSISSTDPRAPQGIDIQQWFAFAHKMDPDPAWPTRIPVAGQGMATDIQINARIPVLLAGIDPDAERQLAGLDKGIISGRYLTAGDRVEWQTLVRSNRENDYFRWPIIPVLVNLHAFRTASFSLAVEELNADLSVKGTYWQEHLNPEQMAAAIVEGAYFDPGVGQKLQEMHSMMGKSGPLTYQPTVSPYPERWPVAVRVEPQAADLSGAFGRYYSQVMADVGPTFRLWQDADATLVADNREQNGRLGYNPVGTFDSAGLSMVKDPVTNMPLMTYRPADALQVLDENGQPLNPPWLLSGGISPVGFLSSPPALVTTIEGAVAVAGDGVINAVQVKVAGADHFTPETVDRVRQIAREIEQRTGLTAEVVMGSSPINVLIQVPPSGDSAGFGWVEERWIHKNAAVTTVQQVEFGYSSFVMMVLVVGVIYAVATAMAGVTARRRELGLAVAVGWPGRAIAGVVVGEQLILGLIAGLLAAAAALTQGAAPASVGLVAGVGVLMYFPAMLAAGFAASRTAPGAALRWGDTAPGRRLLPGTGVLPLAVASLMGRPVRILLTVIAIALPSAILLVLAFTSQHLQGVLYTTLTGQFAALKVGPVQYLMGVIALAIAAVISYDLIHQNAVDHRQERAILFAVGWPRWRIAAGMVAEGILLGAIAGLLGVGIGLMVLIALYGKLTGAVWPVAAMVLMVPLGLGLVTGLLAAMLELGAWDRASLAGLRAGQVIRFGRGTVAAAALAALILVGAMGYVLWPSLAAQVESQTAVVETPTERAVAEIEAAVALQNEALGQLDIDAFAETIDPLAKMYLAQQRHRLEELQEPVGRSVSHVALLGDNTASVQLLERVAGGAPVTLSTVWVRLGDRWYEHGYQRQVLSTGDVVVWYPSSAADETTAAQVAANAAEALAEAERLGWQIDRPITIAFAGPEERDRLQRLPGYVAAGTSYGPLWSEYGEPIVITRGGVPGASTLLLELERKAVMERSHNRGADWLLWGVQARGYYGRAGVSKSELLRELGQAGPAKLDDLHRLHPDYETDVAEMPRLMGSAVLFLNFLEERHGAKALPEILDRLAQSPVDLRRSSPQTWDARHEATVQAVESITGERWDELDRAFSAWIGQ